MSKDTHSLKCRFCATQNRVPVEKALQDLSKVRCGSCKKGLLMVNGEPLIGLQNDDLSHSWDREALKKLKAIPYADKILSKVFSATLDKLTHFHLLAAAVRVSEIQAPRLYRLYLEAAGRIDIEPPPLFIIQTPEMNAFAIGAGSEMVAVTSGLLDGMEEREIVGILGHELTHVKLGHVLYRTLAILLIRGGLGVLDKLFGIGNILIMPIKLALYRWYQMSELSADRGELLAVGSIDTFIRTHMLLSGGNTRFLNDMNTEAFLEQAREAEEMRDNEILVYVMELMDSTARTHPLPAWRVHHGLNWAHTERFLDILAGQMEPKLIEAP